jgi:putative transposase
VTICTRERACLLGHVVNGEMRLNEFGTAVHEEWLKTAELRENVEMEACTVMPNHVHGIVVITNGRGTARRAPTTEQFGKPSVGSMPTTVRSYKSSAARHAGLAAQLP